MHSTNYILPLNYNLERNTRYYTYFASYKIESGKYSNEVGTIAGMLGEMGYPRHV
jgi:hypothetical protein